MIVALEKLPLADREMLFKELWQSLLQDYQVGNKSQTFHQSELDMMMKELNQCQFDSSLNHASELQQRFLKWRADYEKSIADLDDGWTDEMHDELWASVRDKNDIGCEVSFE